MFLLPGVAISLLACHGRPFTGPGSTADPAAARIITIDIAHFWSAYDAGASTGAFQGQYLHAGSRGLKDFIGLQSAILMRARFWLPVGMGLELPLAPATLT